MNVCVGIGIGVGVSETRHSLLARIWMDPGDPIVTILPALTGGFVQPVNRFSINIEKKDQLLLLLDTRTREVGGYQFMVQLLDKLDRHPIFMTPLFNRIWTAGMESVIISHRCNSNPP